MGKAKSGNTTDEKDGRTHPRVPGLRDPPPVRPSLHGAAIPVWRGHLPPSPRSVPTAKIRAYLAVLFTKRTRSRRHLSRCAPALALLTLLSLSGGAQTGTAPQINISIREMPRRHVHAEAAVLTVSTERSSSAEEARSSPGLSLFTFSLHRSHQWNSGTPLSLTVKTVEDDPLELPMRRVSCSGCVGGRDVGGRDVHTEVVGSDAAAGLSQRRPRL